MNKRKCCFELALSGYYISLAGTLIIGVLFYIFTKRGVSGGE